MRRRSWAPSQSGRRSPSPPRRAGRPSRTLLGVRWLRSRIWSPFKLEPPYTMRVQYIEEKYAEGMREQSDIFRVDDTTVEQVRDSLDELVF